jgi:hypothetical protein
MGVPLAAGLARLLKQGLSCPFSIRPVALRAREGLRVVVHVAARL